MSSGSEQLLAEYLGVLPKTPEALALRQLVEIGVSVVAADEGSLLVIDPDGRNLRFAMTVGSSEEKLLGQRVPIGSGITGLAAATRQVQVGAPIYRDVAQTERLSEGPESVIAAPMMLGDTVVGVMTAVTFAKGRLFTAKETDLYARFSAVAALVVEQTRLLKARDGSGAQPAAGLGEATRIEQEILGRLQRIVANRPAALAPLAQILSGIEAIMGRG
jgi:GAF domain-containing protein